jgi:hypothetical protein
MSVKLVVDNGVEVSGLGLTAELRGLADRIDAGEYADATKVVAIVVGPQVARELLGEEMSGNELVCVLEQVKFWTLFDDE